MTIRMTLCYTGADGNPTKLEYRVWNPFRSKLAAGNMMMMIMRSW